MASVMKTTVSTPLSVVTENVNAFESREQEVSVHLPLLYKIAMSLGFNDHELHTLIDDVCSTAIKQNNRQNEDLPLKILLAKNLVYQCVFCISKRLFQQPGKNTNEMPLSFWVVYRLKTIIGFNDRELAVLLNTSPANIRTRLNKALLFLAR
jgi:hypothetical protein